MPFSAEVEQVVKTMYHSLREKDRRRYAAAEAAKLGHGGVEYVAALLGSACDSSALFALQGPTLGLWTVLRMHKFYDRPLDFLR